MNDMFIKYNALVKVKSVISNMFMPVNLYKQQC